MNDQINSKDFDMEQSHKKLKAAGLDAPVNPGIYIMKDDSGKIIYIGKAKNLKNRIKSYFYGEKDIKTATLMRYVCSIETIIVSNEYEALLLENTLIKQHSPKYNINLKDGKVYPLIRITDEEFPRIFRTRRMINDSSRYYGPYANTQGLNSMMETIDKLFPLRKCKNKTLCKEKTVNKKINKKDPCMYYHINRCMAPCCGKINATDYKEYVQRVEKLLSGEKESLIIDLTYKMHDASHKLQFEKAAEYRNAIRAIENLTGEDSSVEDLNPENRDYIAWAAEGVFAAFTVFSMRGGKMTGRDLFRTISASNEMESLELFITSYYDKTRLPPLKVYLQSFIKDVFLQTETCSFNNLLLNWFKESYGYETELLSATDKHHGAILAMARQNAEEDLRRRLKERGADPALDELKEKLNLKSKPVKIEGFDISHLDGKYPTASLISFKNGVPDKKNYRHYKLRTVIGKIDDIAAMREVIHRRYSRLVREEAELPDLILVDGGRGQVNAAKEVLEDVGLNCDLVGLAKREEELWLPNISEPVILSRQSEALKVLQFVRDECHRFAINFNRMLRSKDLFFPLLESIEGIGPKRAALIMKTYETVANIATCDPVEMAKHCKISKAVARAVRSCAKNEIF